MRKKTLAIIFITIIVIATAGSAIFHVVSKKEISAEVKTLSYENQDLKIKIQYPDNYKKTPINETYQKANIIFRAERISPDAMFSIKFEKGLGVLKVMGSSILDNLVNQVNRRYPSRFPNYQKTSYEKKVIANEDAAIFGFTYTGTDKLTTMKQKLVIIVKDATAFYISAQAKETDFEKIEKEFDSILSNTTFFE